LAPPRVRLDERVVELGLEPTRSRARARILAGDVRLGDQVLDKAGTLVAADAALSMAERPRFVSRGGEKLAGALEAFALDPSGLRCADVGLVTADLSFISLRKVLARLAALARPGGQLLLLVKPQFELERGAVGSGGVVRDPAERERAVRLVSEAAAELRLAVRGEAESVLPGPSGNRERFLWLQCPPQTSDELPGPGADPGTA
jgi:predicted rRNA methylase YqxC with S4 and FtsJ domains